MTVVIDVGCECRAGEESVHKLVEQFKPELLLGYDPGARAANYTWHGTEVHIFPQAAWIRDGFIGWYEAGNDGIESFAVEDDGVETQVPCFDLARVVATAAPVPLLVLKMDIEGGEYTLIPHLIETGAIHLVNLLLIEWHGAARISVPVPTELW